MEVKEKKKPYPLSNYQKYRESKNPYAEKVKAFEANEGHPKTLLSGEEAEARKGGWRSHFNCSPETKLSLELGTYHGETSIHLAKQFQEWVHVGIEWKFKVCYKGGKKARDERLKNLTFLRANSARLPWIFAKGEVDRVWVLFPDPWSKASQNKWRLLQPEFFQILGAILKVGAELLIKTDHAEYFSFLKDSVVSTKLFEEISLEEAEDIWSLIPPTPFERIFRRQSLPIYSIALVRNNNDASPPEWARSAISGI